MELYLHKNGEQVGPYAENQISLWLASGAVSRNDLVWHEGLTEWQPLHMVFSLPAPVASLKPAERQMFRPHKRPATSRPIMTNVQQGAIIGGWVCLGLGILCMLWSYLLFFLYGPFFLAAFVLSIVAMSQRRIFGGIALLVSTLLLPSIVGAFLFTFSERPTAIANSMKKGFEDARGESDQRNLKGLRQRKTEFDKKLVALKGFRVVSANFTKEEDSIGMRKPIIALSIQNDTGHAIKRAYFRGILSSPGRSIPWIDDTFNYEISGGVEPSEKADWKLAPNMFGDWGKVDAAPDAQLTVTVIGLDGADGKALFGDVHFGEHDEKRLEELEKKYGNEQEIP